MDITPQQKLEILCAYLPHGVECMNEDEKIILIGIRYWIGWCGVHKFESGDNNVPINYLHPILRHPDDMTEEELQKLADITDGVDIMLGVTWQKYLISLETAHKALRYLHSLHIDTFGAIEAGWAVRKEVKNG